MNRTHFPEPLTIPILVSLLVASAWYCFAGPYGQAEKSAAAVTASTPHGPDIADAGSPAIRAYNDSEGLPQNSVLGLAFDRTGHLWAATQDGAAYYDGRKWTALNMPNRAVSNYVRGLLAASDGSLWFGTLGAGVARLKEGGWVVYNKGPDQLPGDRVRCVAEGESADGRPVIWVGTNSGLARFEDDRWTSFDTANSGLPANGVWSLLETRSAEGRRALWIGTEGGLTRLEDGRWTTYNTGNSGLPHNHVFSLLETPSTDGSPGLWVGTLGGGLARFEEGRWTTFDSKTTGVPIDKAYQVVESTSPAGYRTLWVGSDKGLARLKDGRWALYDSKNSALPSNIAFSLLEAASADGRRMLWVGTLGGGVVRLQPDGWVSYDARRSGLPGDKVYDILETSSGGASIMWLATDNGLARFEGGRWTVYDIKNSGLPDNSVRSLLEVRSTDGERALWAATTNGLACLRQGRWTVYNTKNSGLPDNFLYSLIETKGPGGESRIWAGTNNGIGCLAEGRWTVYNTKNSGLPANIIPSLYETKSIEGRSIIWVCTAAGLTRFEDGRWTTYDIKNSGLPNNDTLSLFETRGADGRSLLWVGTFGGLARFDPGAESNSWVTFSDSTRPRLPNNVIGDILEDGQGRLYIFTLKGIARLTPRKATPDDPAEFDVYTFTTEDGLAGKGIYAEAAMLDSRGRIWAGTEFGATMFDPSRWVADSTPKPLVIERTLVNQTRYSRQGRRQSADGGQYVGPGGDSPSEDALAHYENNLLFEYALLGYFKEEETRYRTELVGVDANPGDWTADYKKEYTTLGAGDYIFRVWGKDHAGNVSGPVEVAFKIRPAPWRSWWAYSLYALAAGAAIFGLVRFQVNQTKRRGEQALQRQEERARLQEAELRAEAAELQARAVEAENRRKSEELAFARQLQLSMLPRGNINLDEVEIIASMRTATEVGGDYYDFIRIDEHRYCLALGDATGHGIAAGLVVSMVKMALVNSARSLGPASSVRELMSNLNVSLKASLSQRGVVGMCLSLTVLDTRTMTAETCSTGLPYPCLYRGATGQVEPLSMPGPPLGFLKRINVSSQTFRLNPGDTFVFMTDGFPERINPQGEGWGYDTVAGVVTRICSEEASAERVVARLIASSDEFAQGVEVQDDMTVMVIRVKDGFQVSGAGAGMFEIR